MRRALAFLKTTIVGGLLFLLPVAILVLLLQKVWPVARAVVDPAVEVMPRHLVAGIAVGAIGATLLLILVAFCAGLVARTRAGQALVGWFENSMIGALPQYRVVRSIADSYTSELSAHPLTPVLVEADPGFRYGFLVESCGNGLLAVFLPDAPHPLSGAVHLVPETRVRVLDVPVADIVQLLRHLGAGSARLAARLPGTPH